MEQAFTKTKRLLTKKEYERVFKQSKKIDTPAFFVLTASNNKDNARIGFALSKKYLPSACLRNRVKRIFRESFRCQKLENVDIIVLAKSGLSKLDNEELRMSLTVLWEKINKIYG